MLKTVFNATIIVAGTNITNSAAKIELSDESIGIVDTYIRADCPKPLTITSAREAIKKVIESLSPTFNDPTMIPKTTKNAYGKLLEELTRDFCNSPIKTARTTPIKKA